MQRTIYAHHSSASKRSSLRRLSATDVSIKEEKEPCELHDKLLCLECQDLMQEKMNKVLKRSVSYNALNNTKKMSSVRNVHRSLSQSSCYSTSSAMTAQLNSESFNEFLCFLSGEEYYEKANSLWENLSSETKEIFVARVLAKRKVLLSRNPDQSDVINLVQPNNIPKPEPRNSIHKSAKRTDSDSKGCFKDSNIVEMVDQLYNHEPVEEGREAFLIGNLSREERAQSKFKEPEAAGKDAQCELTSQPVDAQYLREVKLWRDRQEITERIKELTTLIEKFERYAVSPTARSIHSTHVETEFPNRGMQETDVLKHIEIAQGPTPIEDGNGLSVNLERPDRTQTRNSIIERITRGSKRFFHSFKRKKRPVHSDIYRKPNPNLRVLVDPKNLQKVSRE